MLAMIARSKKATILSKEKMQSWPSSSSPDFGVIRPICKQKGESCVVSVYLIETYINITRDFLIIYTPLITVIYFFRYTGAAFYICSTERLYFYHLEFSEILVVERYYIFRIHGFFRTRFFIRFLYARHLFKFFLDRARRGYFLCFAYNALRPRYSF